MPNPVLVESITKHRVGRMDVRVWRKNPGAHTNEDLQNLIDDLDEGVRWLAIEEVAAKIGDLIDVTAVEVLVDGAGQVWYYEWP